ncbi:hypothetical protein JCM11957_00750 [Caminibacter profundus]
MNYTKFLIQHNIHPENSFEFLYKHFLPTLATYDYLVDWNKLFVKDTRGLSFLENESIDFILTHPPYANIIKYSNDIKDDLSHIKDLEEFCDEMEKIAKEFYRVLKKSKYCAILIGDTRRNKMYQPLAFMVMQRFLKVGFKLKEDIIKHQYNCKATGFWVKKSKEYNFLLIMHEQIFIFQK